MQLDLVTIAQDELTDALYGISTAHAVLAYKQKRQIINRNYQKDADDITGRMTVASLDKELFAKEGADPDFIFLTDQQKATVKSDLLRSSHMLNAALNRLRTVWHGSQGGLLVTPRNLVFYDTKLKILNVFHINTFTPDDLPAPPEVLDTLRQRFKGLQALPQPSTSPADAINFVTLFMNFTQLSQSMNQKFRKEFYTRGSFKGQPMGYFAAFVDATNPADSTVRITSRYFDRLVVPTADSRAVTLAHERAHTIFRANGHPGTGDNPFCVAPHLGDPNVKSADQALANPYCYEWLIDSLQSDYNAAAFLAGCVVTR